MVSIADRRISSLSLNGLTIALYSHGRLSWGRPDWTGGPIVRDSLEGYHHRLVINHKSATFYLFAHLRVRQFLCDRYGPDLLKVNCSALVQ
jgi:hypothetical protein